MIQFYYALLIVLTAPVLAMDPKGSQLELCASRRAYIQGQKSQPSQSCVFCDAKVLAQNHILIENFRDDVRIMMNKNPYFPFDQGYHLLIMPISHKEQPADFSQRELAQQTYTALFLSVKLHNGSYSQEYFTNWGKLSGQSVLHWHSQMKVYTKPALSLPESARNYKDSSTNNIESALALVRSKLALSIIPLDVKTYTFDACKCCCVRESHGDDENNFVIGRFKYNLVCLSHYPNTAAEVAVIPYRHIAAMKDLCPEELRENMALSMALLPTLKTYAENSIRDCDGGNIYTKSMGSEAPMEMQKNHHVCTLVMPRTVIAATPGTLEGNSCKLDFDPGHLFAYLKEFHAEFTAKINEGLNK
jgi:diadenosine tetraphosphate (Ap4A) HIT family hydrolase